MTDNENKPAAALEPCPFCGDEDPRLAHDDAQDAYYVSCTDCGATMVCDQNDDDRHVKEAWNRRATKASAVPEGWKLVPLILSDEMITAFHVEEGESACNKWDALLTAAPSAPQAEEAPAAVQTAQEMPKSETNQSLKPLSERVQPSIDTPEFRTLLWEFWSQGQSVNRITGIIAHIDAKLTQAEKESSMYFAERNSARDAVYRYREEVAALQARALKAENQLAAIRSCVEDLPVDLATDYASACVADGYARCRKDVLALLEKHE